MSDKYAAISKHREQYPLRLMCDALEVSTSGYYAAGLSKILCMRHNLGPRRELWRDESRQQTRRSLPG